MLFPWVIPWLLCHRGFVWTFSTLPSAKSAFLGLASSTGMMFYGFTLPSGAGTCFFALRLRSRVWTISGVTPLSVLAKHLLEGTISNDGIRSLNARDLSLGIAKLARATKELPTSATSPGVEEPYHRFLKTGR